MRLLLQASFALVFILSVILTGEVWSSLASTFSATQFLPSLIKALGPGLSIAAATVASTLAMTWLFGRLYCSTLCPLGAAMDLASWTAARLGIRRGRGYRPRAAVLRWPFFILVAATATFGLPFLLELVEPWGLFARGARGLVRPLYAGAVALVDLAARGAGSYGPPPVALEGDPLVLAVAGLSFAALVVAAALRGRIFCDWLCPTGAALELLASRSLLGLSLGDSCDSCGACARGCRSSCIDIKRGRIERGRCVLCLDCLEACPRGAISFSLLRGAGGRKGPAGGAAGVGAAEAAAPLPAAATLPAATSPARAARPIPRRLFLAEAAALAAGCALPAVLSAAGLGRGLPARARLGGIDRGIAVAPGAGSVARLGSRCTGCGLCVARCPTGVLRHASPRATGASSPASLAGALLPFLDYSRAWCSYDCVTCTGLCPTGALLPLALAEKRLLSLGESRLELSRCIVVAKGTSCGACAEHCPTGAVTMREILPGRPTEPRLDPGLCVGCGACETICPTRPLKAIWVDGKPVHGVARLPAGGKTLAGDSGFAF